MALNNSLLTIDMITREALRVFKNSNVLLQNVDRQYDPDFGRTGAKIGDNLRIRLPNDFTVRRGNAASVQNTNERNTTLTVANLTGVDIAFTESERALSLDDYSKRVIMPAMNVIASTMAQDLMGCVDSLVPSGTLSSPTLNPAANFVGKFDASGNVVTPDIQAFLDAKATLEKRGATGLDYKMILDPTTQARTIGQLSGLFNPQNGIGEQYRTGNMREALGFDWMMDQTTLIHTTGAYGAPPTVSGASQTGGTLTVSALGGPVKAGDVFTIAGVNAVNRITKADQGELAQFVVTADAASGATSLSIYPSLTPPSGGNSVQYQTVTASPANGAQVSFVTKAGTSYRSNIAYVPEAITLVTADQELPRGVHEAYREVYDNVSLRIVTAYDVNTNQMITRIEVLYGFQITRPEWVVRVADKV